MANLRLVAPNGTTYNFPQDFWLDDMSYHTTQSVKNVAFSPGGRDVADGYLEARNIVIVGALRADTLAGMETLERAFHKAMLRGGQLYVSDDVVMRFISVKSPQVNFSYIGDYRYEKPVTVSFVAEYPFWEDDTLTESAHVLTGDDEFTVDNSSSDSLVFPIITIEADQLADIPAAKLINKSDGAMTFEYNDPNFVQGDVLVINCREGTVKRNNNNTISYFNPARFLRLQDVINTIAYEGNACTITISFRKVYL